MALTEISMGNVAQIWSPYFYLAKYAPQYTPAWVTNSIFCAVAVGTCFLIQWCLRRDNRKLDVQERENIEAGGVDDGKPKFRYML